MDCVDSVSRSPVDNSTARNSQKAPNFAADLHAAQVKISQSQTSDITIVTAEGDTVTLSSNSSSELTFATYNAQGQVGGASQSFSGMSAEFHHSNAFSFSVDGDLNKEELKDIRRAIRTIQKAATDVLKGHEEKAASRTAKLARLDQIASIDADLEFHREVSVTRVSAESETTAIPDSSEPTSPAIVAPTSDSQQTTEETGSAETSETAAPAQTSNAVETQTTASVTSATTSSHLSVLIQTSAGSPAPNSTDTSTSGLWWLPTSDLWNILHPRNGALTATTPATDSTTLASA